MENRGTEVMSNYFESMLKEDCESSNKSTTALKTVVDERQNNLDLVSSLLAKTNLFNQDLDIAEVDAESLELANEKLDLVTNSTMEEVQLADIPKTTVWQNLDLGEEFQVLFFQLAEITFAIPLVSLGGIHRIDQDLNIIIDKPNWYMGLINNKGTNYNIIDTAKWIEPNRGSTPIKYEYYILLGGTYWGLACENLIGTELINRSQVKWRVKQGKRPWLAGMVKDQMCALLHTEELVNLLTK